MSDASALRYLASEVIGQVSRGRSLQDALPQALRQVAHDDEGLLQALCYGVCRFYSRLEFVLRTLLKKPLDVKDHDLHALLLVGLFQLMMMRIPDYAAVTETVNAVMISKKRWAKGLVNAVLRNYLRQKLFFDEAIRNDACAYYAHPSWWIDAISKAWPCDWQGILLVNNEQAPFTLRVNLSQISRENYLKKLAQQGFTAHINEVTEAGITLVKPIDVVALPGFAEGEVTVQDAAAQLAAPLLALQPGQAVLDACAAPGGKLTHLLEIAPNLARCVAVDSDKARMERVKANLARLQQSHRVQCVVGDILDEPNWGEDSLFDRILLDAPCSASGVIRRHPDIKLLRRPKDIAAFGKQQLALLNALWPQLKVGGLLVYATCSLFPAENSEVLQQFLATHEDAEEEKISAEWGIACLVGRQILPGWHNMDGFYYGRLKKIASLS